MKDVVFQLDPAGRWAFLNPAWTGLTGFSIEETLGRSYQNYLHPDHQDECRRIFEQLVSCQKDVCSQEVRFKTSNNAYRWCEIYARLTFDDAGQVCGISGSLNDISERKQAEDDLRASQTQLLTFVKHAPAAVCMVDTEMRYIIASQRWLVDYKLGQQDLTGRSHYDIFPTIPERWKEIHRHCLTGVSASADEDSFAREDGTLEWLRWEIHPWYTGDGQIGGLIFLSEVITPRKKAEQALVRSEARNRAYLYAIPDLMFRISRGGTYVDYRAEKEGLNLLAAPDLIGRKVQDVLPEELARQTLYYIEQALQTGETQIYEYQLKINNRLKDFEARVVVSGEDETLFIVRDFTERKNVERLKSEFISNVSHELRTPLTSIRGSLGLVLGGLSGQIPDTARAMLDIAYKNSERLVRLINDILDVEKIESGNLVFNISKIELNHLLEQTIEANQGYAEHFKVNFELQPAALPTFVLADSDRLMQVITNLLSNAAKFSPANATVQIKAELLENKVRVAISDRGAGIPEEFQGRIFQKFAQADSSNTRSKGGTGLGLSISKSIIERHGGQINFESRPGQGTTFYFELPLWQARTTSDRVIRPEPPAVLVCEDDPDVAAMLKVIFGRQGYRVEVAGTLADARRLLADPAAPFAVLILDLLLPDGNGLDLITELCSNGTGRQLPVVVVSSVAEAGRKKLNGCALSVLDWLEKPVDHRRLLAAVKRGMRQAQVGKTRVLHVEDDQDIQAVVATMLGSEIEVVVASNLAEAQAVLEHTTDIDLVLLDLGLPDGSGLELLPLLQRDNSPAIPALIFSARELEPASAAQVSAALVKSRTSNEQLVQTVKRLVEKN